MNVYAIEENFPRNHCKVNARNCKYYSSVKKAKQAVSSLLSCCHPEHHFENFIDDSMAITSTDLDILYWITRIKIL